MKKIGVLVGVCLSALLLASCGTSSSTSSSGSKAKGSYQTTGTANSGEYKGIITNGRYRTSKSRGVGVSQNTENMLNLKSFESGLTTISKDHFSPKSYVFQEGQILSKGTVENWLGRKSKDNPEGLNPKDNGKKDANKRNPIYVQQIEEQDYMKEENGKLHLAGITIGIGMNRKDYYQKEEYGATYTTDIPKEQMIAEGKKAAAKVLARLRSYNAVGSSMPIVIAMYQQAPNDSLVGGTFYATTVSNSGTQMGTWKATDLKNYVFPVTDTDTVPSKNDADSFDNFKNKIQNFFPNLAGVTAQAQYDGDSLQGLNVTITTQFYSETEITSFTQYVAKAAQTYLPSGIKVDIQIQGSDGSVQSFVARDNGDKGFYTHVFSSY